MSNNTFFLLVLLPIGIMILWAYLQYDSDYEAQGNARRVLFNAKHSAETIWKNAAHGQILFYPVKALYTGDLASSANMQPTDGMIGITDQTLLFTAPDQAPFHIPLATIRWFRLTPDLNLHCETQDGWHVYSFKHLPQSLVDKLLESSHAQSSSHHPTYGPEWTMRLIRDIYGQWNEDFSVRLYLAPDRLLCNWRSSILFSDIQQITVVSHLTAHHLLRIDYLSEFRGLQSVGFAMSHSSATKWSSALSKATGKPVEMQVGRKKKETENDTD